MINILLLIWVHFVADFILQSDWMARGKSKDSWILLTHVLIYTVPLLLLGIFFMLRIHISIGSPLAVHWALVNGVLHFATDYVSSRITTKLWSEQKVHWFFVVIGCDQAVHMTCLVVTYYYFFQ